MNIFENLEQLNVSEECFNNILNIVENKLKDRMTMGQLREKAGKVRQERLEKLQDLEKKYGVRIKDLPNVTAQTYHKIYKDMTNKVPELKRAEERYNKAHFNSVGSDKDATRERGTTINREANKAYPDSMTVRQAQQSAEPKDEIVKSYVTPSIKSVGSSNIKKQN